MDTSLLKNINVNKVRNALRQAHIASKNTLSKMTSLSVATCGNILRELEVSGEVSEVQLAQSTGGRPSKRYAYNKDFAHILKAYVRKENQEKTLIYEVTDILGQTIEAETVWMDFIRPDHLIAYIQGLIDKYPRIKVISFGLPGLVAGGYVDFCDIEELSQCDLKNRLVQATGKTVLIDNDVNITAVGYYYKHHLMESSFVYLYYPLKGMPGAGIVLDGKVLKGCSNFSGEVSFLPVENRSTDESDSVFNIRVSATIRSITCLINPKTVVLSGFRLKESDLEYIYKDLSLHLPKQHMPEVLYVEDMHEDYMTGLWSLAIEEYQRLETL